VPVEDETSSPTILKKEAIPFLMGETKFCIHIDATN